MYQKGGSIMNRGYFCFTFTLAIFCIAILAMPASSELVALWQFEDGEGDIAEDNSGREHDGLLNGCTFDEGKFDGGLRFDAGNFMEVPGHKDFNFTDNLTLALWANIEDLPKDHVGIPGKGHDLAIGSFVLHPTKLNVDEYELRFYVSIDAAWPMAKGGEPIAFLEWHHLAVTYDGSESRIYVDGELAGSLKQEGELNLTEDSPFKFANDFGGRQLVGWLDEIYIYDHVMAEAGIQSIMEGRALSVSPDEDLIATRGELKSE